VARPEHIAISKRLVAVNAASTLMARMVNFLVMLWVYRFLLLRLPTEEFAVLPVVLSIMVFTPLFFSFLAGGVSRYTIDAYARGDFLEVTRISSSLFPLLLAASAVFVATAVLFTFNIERFLKLPSHMVAEARIMLLLLTISHTFEMMIVPFKTAYAIRQRYFEQSVLQVLRDMFRALLIVILLASLRPSVLWVVVATFIADFSLLSVFLLRSRRMVPELRVDPALFSLAKARVLISFGLWTTVGRLGSIMFTNFATIVLNVNGTATDVTNYHIGATFFRQIQSTVNLATLPLQPAMTAMNALDGSGRLMSTVIRGARYAIWASMLVATPLIVFADVFIDLYLGDGFEAAGITLLLFMVMFPFLHSTALLAHTAIATARVREFYLPAFFFPFAGLIVTIMTARYSDVDAVIVTVVLTATVIVSQVGYFWSLQLRIVGAGFHQFARSVLIRGLLPATAAAMVMAGLRVASPPGTWFSLLTFSAIGVLTYAFALVVFAATPRDKSDVSNIISGTVHDLGSFRQAGIRRN
jgi:O-antigen/teichoic acid export membrane protein